MRTYRLFGRLIWGGVMLLLCGGLYYLLGRVPSVAALMQTYVGKPAAAALSFAFSFTSQSVFELLLYAVIVFWAGSLLVSVFASFNPLCPGAALVKWVVSFFCFASFLLLFFLSVFGVNYFAPTLETTLSLSLEGHSEGTLFKTTHWLGELVNQSVSEVPREADGRVTAGGFDALAPMAGRGFLKLGETYEIFNGGMAPPKKVAVWQLLSYGGIDGIYSPFTGECNVNPTLPDSQLPFVMCHEMAHRMGIAPEEDANFAAFLACLENGDPVYRYSGALSAFSYCVQQLPSGQALTEIWDSLSPLAKDDLHYAADYYEQFEGPAQEVSLAMNDAYLQAMGQEQGIKSYGRVAELLMAEYCKRNPSQS